MTLSLIIIAGTLIGVLAAFISIAEAIIAYRAGIAAREAIIRRIMEAR